MTTAVVVVAPTSTIDLAVAWGRRGLVADSLWVSSDELTGIDPDAPNAVQAARITFDREPVRGPLALQLAELGPLVEARVTWLRSSDATNEMLLEALDDLLRDLLPHDQMHWLDIVVPLRRTDEAVAPLAGEWVQFRIHPSDRPAPDVTDAGWDLGRAVPLHVTLALTGVLGGLVSRVPWAQINASENWIVRVFSRLVDGGLQARRAAGAFVFETLPSTHAAEQHREEFLAAGYTEAEGIVEDATRWLMEVDDYALSYRPPATSRFRGQPWLTEYAHLLNFWRFLPTGIMALFGLEPKPNAKVGHVLEFDDLGYNVGKPVKVVQWTSGIPDFAQLEMQAAQEAEQAIARLRAREGAQPAGAAWEPLVQVSSALVDGGGAVPAGWQPPARAGRRLSVSPEWVVLSSSGSPESEVPELANAENPAVVADALREARRVWPQPLSHESDGTRVTQTARRLADDGNASDARSLATQLDLLGAAPTDVGHRSLLDRIHGRVLGGVVRSRLDAERWTAAATTSTEGGAPRWQTVAMRYRSVWWGVNLLLGVLWWVWATFNEQINSALGWSLDPALGLVLIGVIHLLALVTMLYLFFRGWSVFMERGRRRLELMALWYDRAAQAWAAHGLMANTERVARSWTGILSGLLEPLTYRDRVSGDVEVEQAPLGLRVGHPRFKPVQLEGWLADVGAKPGWRLRNLMDVAGDFLACLPERAIDRLAQDLALPGGLLHRFGRELPELAQTWRSRAVTSVWDEVRALVAENAQHLEIVRSPGLLPEETTLTPFLAGITPTDDEGPWPRDYLVEEGFGDPKSPVPELVVSPALCTARIRIQVRVLDDVDRVEEEFATHIGEDDNDEIR